MVSTADMSLDDIISTTKTNRGGYQNYQNNFRNNRNNFNNYRNENRGRRRPQAGRGFGGGYNQSGRGGGGGGFGNFRGSNNNWGGGIQLSTGPKKLILSNLHFEVSDNDITELFLEFGEVSTAAIHYDRYGRSLGTAHVVYTRHTDALRALRQYNGVHLDGQRMKVIFDPSSPGARQQQVKRFNQGNGNGNGNGNSYRFQGNRRGYNRRQPSQGRGGYYEDEEEEDEVKKPTAEELDKELDAYIKEAKN